MWVYIPQIACLGCWQQPESMDCIMDWIGEVKGSSNFGNWKLEGLGEPSGYYCPNRSALPILSVTSHLKKWLYESSDSSWGGRPVTSLAYAFLQQLHLTGAVMLFPRACVILLPACHCNSIGYNVRSSVGWSSCHIHLISPPSRLGIEIRCPSMGDDQLSWSSKTVGRQQKPTLWSVGF